MLEGIPRLKTFEDLLSRAREGREFSQKESDLFLKALSKLEGRKYEQVVNALKVTSNIADLMSPPANSADTLSAQQSEHQS